LRKRRNGPQLIEIEAGDGIANNIVEPSKDSHDLNVSKQEAEPVRAAIQELPVDFREIILLREYEELSYLEIASVLDCPVGTVMSRLGRARAKLRVLLLQNVGARFVLSERHKMKGSSAPVVCKDLLLPNLGSTPISFGGLSLRPALW
jgi:hypothetical protein